MYNRLLGNTRQARLQLPSRVKYILQHYTHTLTYGILYM